MEVSHLSKSSMIMWMFHVYKYIVKLNVFVSQVGRDSPQND